MVKKYKVNIKIYSNLKKRIQQFVFLNKLQVRKEKNFFAWAFHIIHTPRYSFLKLKKQLKKKTAIAC